jgi:hypothetical protein
MNATEETTSTLSTYPEWQKVIREAQYRQTELYRQIHEAAAIEARKLDEAKAELLGEALALFGIDARPTENRYQLGSIVFSLERVAETLKRGAFYDFRLLIAYALEPKYVAKADDYYGHLHSLRIEEASEYDWNAARARMADAIDQVTRGALQFMAHLDADERNAATAPPKPSIAEQLAQLIREIATAEFYEF